VARAQRSQTTPRMTRPEISISTWIRAARVQNGVEQGPITAMVAVAVSCALMLPSLRRGGDSEGGSPPTGADPDRRQSVKAATRWSTKALWSIDHTIVAVAGTPPR